MDESSTDYRAYYYATCQDITQAQMRERDNIPIIDISRAKAFMDQYGIQGVCSDEAHYPSKLLTVPSPPTVLFIKGDITCISTPTIAIVGPRKMSDYAKQLIDLLFVELSHYRLTTISGLAEGVDSHAHRLSLQYSIPTIAVLGGGFAHYQRTYHRSIIQEIVDKGGAVISDYKHDFAPTNRSFPRRNRLIAGLADIIFLPEAHEKSGSLITVEIGRKLHKPIYAPMGSILTPSSTGSNAYISQQLIIPLDRLDRFLADHFSRMDDEVRTMNSCISLTEQQTQIMDIIDQHGVVNIAQLIESFAGQEENVFTSVSMLEMNNLIGESSPGIYMRKK